jgi:hypothetical protein
MNNIIAHFELCPSCKALVPAGSVRRYICKKCNKTYRYCGLCAVTKELKCAKCKSELIHDGSIFNMIMDIIFPGKSFMR